MSAKSIFPVALMMIVLGCCTARGQSPNPANATDNEDAGAVPALAGDEHKTFTPEPPGHLSPYITYERPDCCGHLGGGPIFTELYFRTGPSAPVGGAIFGHVLEIGWEYDAGARSLFYNAKMDAAWVVDLGLSTTFNHGQHGEIHIPLSIFVPVAPLFPGGNPGATRVNFGNQPGVPGVTIRSLNRTALNYSLGREWYLWGTAHDAGPKWRVGADFGGIWGSQKAEFNEIKHRTSVIEGTFLALHTDWEYPCCSVTFLAGCRLECAYTWGNVLQDQNNSDVADVNLLFTCGVRF